MTYHCWTYKNKNNEWCVTEKGPCDERSQDFSLQSAYKARSDEILGLLKNIKKDLSHYSHDEKIKAEQRKLSGKGLDGSGGRGKKKNLVENFPQGLDDDNSDNTRFEQGKKLEQTEKPKAKLRQKEHGNTAPGKSKTVSPNSDEVNDNKHSGESLQKRAEKQKRSIWEGA